jgi:hypothetical protein
MRFTVREIVLDVALVILALLVWFADRNAVIDALDTAQAIFWGGR